MLDTFRYTDWGAEAEEDSEGRAGEAVRPPPSAPSILSTPYPNQGLYPIPTFIFNSSTSTPYLNQGLYPHPTFLGAVGVRQR